MQYLIRVIPALIFCLLPFSTSIALDFSGSTVISSDVDDGLNAVGGVEGDILIINQGVTISTPSFTTTPNFYGVSLNGFPFEVKNDGTVDAINGVFFNKKGSLSNKGNIFYDVTGISSFGEVNIDNSGIITGGFSNAVDIYSGKVTNSGFISGGQDIVFRGSGTVINSGTIDTNISISKSGSVSNSGTIFGNVLLFGGGTITNRGAFSGGTVIHESGSLHNTGVISGGASIAGQGILNNSGTISEGVGVAIGAINNNGVINGESINVQIGEGNINNNGTISGEGNNILIVGRGTFTNNGQISGGYSRVQAFGESNIINNNSISTESRNEISLFGGGSITNNGLISGDNSSFLRLDKGGKIINNGSLINNNSTFNGSILMLDGGELSNNGTIIDFNINIRDGVVLINNGHIISNKKTNQISTLIELGGGMIINRGTITTDYAAISLSGDSEIINSGTIRSSIGDIAIIAGNGDDTVILKTGAVVEGRIDGGSNFFNKPENDKVILQGSGTFNDDFQNFEHLRMEGIDWNLTANSSFNDTQITQGLLRINGTHTSPISIHQDGALGGNGTIIGNVSNDGKLAPGNSIGTMTIDGDYVHETDANLVIEFDNSGSDQLIVSGKTTINGGSLTLVPLELIKTAQPFTFLQSGSISGQFDKLFKPVAPAVFDIDIFQDGNTFNLVGRHSYQSLATTDNQIAVASALQDNLSTATGDLQNVMLQLDRLMTKDEFRAALDQLSPEPFAALPQIIFTESQFFTGTIARHLRGIQLSQAKGNHLQQLLPALTYGGNAVNVSSAVPYSASADNVSDTFSSNGWQAYLQPYGIFSRLDSNNEFTGFNANTGGFAAGVDRRVNDSTIVGANLGWSYTDVAWHRPGTQAYIQTGRLSGYWGYQKDRWNLNGIVSYGYHHYDADRRIQFGSINRIEESSHDGHDLAFSLNSAYSFQHRNWIFGPVASIQYTGLFDDSYNESGAGAVGFHFNGDDTHSLRSTLGLFGAVELDLGGKTIIPAVQLGWAHEILNNQYTLNAQIHNTTGGAFTIRGRDLGNDSVYIAAGFTASLNRNTMLRLNYNADIGRTNYNNHMANLMLIMQF